MTSKFLLNYRYGGFGYSELFQTEFLRRNPDVSASTFRELQMSVSISVRSDERFVNLALELGLKNSSGPHCTLVVEEVPTNVLPFVRITEYDGFEAYELCLDKPTLALLHAIMSDERCVVPSELRERYAFLCTVCSFRDL
jgi:hypothetical protein